MKKDEFFAQLRTAFAGMDEELLTDILGDYENHFKVRKVLKTERVKRRFVKNLEMLRKSVRHS